MPNEDQLDDLYTACFDTAVALLEKNGEFFPLAFEMAPGGQISAVAVMETGDHPPSQQVIDSLLYVLRERAGSGEIIASAMAVDTKVRRDPDADPRDALQVRLRAKDYARDVIAPYSMATSGLFRKARKIHFDAPYAQAAKNDIFA